MDAFNDTARTRFSDRAHDAGQLPVLARAAILFSVVSLLSGCHGGVDTDLLEREMRLQEDRIYELEDHLADCHNVAAHYRNENQKLRRQLDAEPSDASDADYPTPSVKSPTRAGQTPTHPVDSIPDQIPDVPKVEGDENGVSGTGTPGAGTPVTLRADPVSGGALDDLATPPIPTTDSDPVDAGPTEAEELPIPLSTEATGPLDRIVVQKILGAATPPAPEGLLLRTVIEPRSPDGLPVRAAGNISLMILDPLKPGTEGKIARWDFTAEDANTHWRRTGLGSGLHFDLPLPTAIENRTYELWARLVAENGEKHLASVEFEANPQLARAHTPTATPRRRSDQSKQSDRPRDRGPATEETAATDAPHWSPSPSAEALDRRAKAEKGERYRAAAAPSQSDASENLAPTWQPGTTAVPPPQPEYRATRPAPEWSPYR